MIVPAFFLHMRAKTEEGWTLVSLILTLLLFSITLAGSLWVIPHLDSNRMPKYEMSEVL